MNKNPLNPWKFNRGCLANLARLAGGALLMLSQGETLKAAAIFQQDFSSSSTVSDYVNASPNNGQWNAISTSGVGVTVVITGGQLAYTTTGANAGAASRTANFSGTAPTTLIYKFDLSVSGNSSAATSAGIFYVGNSIGTGNSAPTLANVQFRFAVNFTTTAGTFTLRDMAASVNSGSLSGNQSITWVMNTSGATVSYRAPDGTQETLADQKQDIWAGTTKIFNDVAEANASAVAMQNMKFLLNASVTGTINQDNIIIDPIPGIPTAALASSTNTSSFTASWSAVSGATTGYRLDVATDSGFTAIVSGFNNLDVGNVTSYSVTGLTSGTTYYYRVRAYDAAGQGANSSTITVATSICPPPTVGTPTASPGLSVCANTTITLATNSISGGVAPFTYQWYKNSTAITGSNSYNLTISSPVNGDQYFYTTTSSCGGTATTSSAVTLAVTANVTPTVSVSANPGFTTCSANQVVFTATPVNGGTPTYQWYLNNSPVGFNSASYTNGSGGLANSDQIYVKMTSSLACVTASIAYSPTNTMTISGSTTPTVGISLNTGTPTNCPGTQIIFTASPTNGGGAPTYIWKTNSVVDPSSTSATYTNSSFVTGETVDCQLNSSDACASPTNASAPQVTLTVKPNLTPTVSIVASPGTTNCPGTQIIFTATPVNGGVSPTYQWKTNGFNSGGNSATYTNSSLANGDVIACVLTPSAEVCASPATATANSLTNYLNPTVTPSVSIAASPGTTNVAGATVTFNATPVNGGVSPGYQWKTNTVSVPGATSSSFATTTLSNNDVVTCVLAPSAEICASPATAISTGITNVIISLPTITTQPQSRTNSVGDNAVFSVSTTGNFRSFQWYLNSAAISDATNSSYTRSSVGAVDVGSYTIIITNIAGAVTSAPAVLTLVGTNSIRIAQWDFNTGDGLGTSNAAIALTSATASLVGGTAATIASGSGSSDPFTPSANNTRWSTKTYPAATVGNKTAGVQFAVSTVGYTNVIVSWEMVGSATASKYVILQYSTNGTDFIDTPKIITVTTSFAYQTYDFSGTAGVADNANFKFRVVTAFESVAVNGGANSYVPVTFTSNYGTGGTEGYDLVTLFAQPLPPAITTQPSSLTNCSGTLASFTAAATGVVTAYPQWQLSTDTGGTWNNIGGATADSYSFTALHADNGKEFRVIYTNAWFASTSAVATLTIRPVPVANNVNYSFNQGSALKLLVASLLTNASDSAAGTISLVSVGNSANGVAVSADATRVSYSGLLTNNDSFTYTVSSSTCGETATGTVFLTAVGNLTGQYSTNFVTVAGTNLTVTFFGISNYTYQVQRSTNLISWVTLLTTNPVASGPFKIQDTIGVAPSSAFYRLLIP